MPRLRLHILPLALLVLAMLPAFFCANRAAAEPDLTLGAGPNSHQQLISELTALLLEKEGLSVIIRRGMSTTELRPLLIRGEIDLCLQALAADTLEKPDTTNIVRLPPLPFATGPVLLMRSQQAAELKIETISQLAELAGANPQKFRFADLDASNVKRLTAAYRLPISARQPLSPSLLYRTLKTGRVDVALGRADDGRIIAFRLIALSDDRKALPDLQITPLTSKAILSQFPAIATTLAHLRKHLNGEAMRRLHGGVVIAHREPRALAREWLQNRHLL